MSFESGEFEGTWEELLANAESFRGKRVRLSVVAGVAHPTQAHQKEAWEAFFQKANQVSPVGDVAPDIGNAIAEKFRRQGFQV